MKSCRVREIQACAKRADVVIASMQQTKTHIRIVLANGRKVFTSATPSDKRGQLNLVCDLKREWAVKSLATTEE